MITPLVITVSPIVKSVVASIVVPVRASPASNTAVPSTVIAPEPERAIVVSEACPSSIEPEKTEVSSAVIAPTCRFT